MIVRKIDNVGRIVIPRGYMKQQNWKPDDNIEVIPTNDGLLLKKYTPSTVKKELLEELNNALMLENTSPIQIQKTVRKAIEFINGM